MFKQASAKKQEAEALRAQMDAMLKQSALIHADEVTMVDLYKKETSAEYDQVRAMKGLQELRNPQIKETRA